MAYRPKNFWPENSKITVNLDFKGTEVGMATKKRPLVGADSRVVTFKIGRNQVTRINLATQTGKVFRDGKQVRTFYVSTGKPGFKTRTGIKVITDKVYNKVFTGEAFNEDYRLISRYALRLTPSGEFLHSATWAYGRLGRWAGSHGCTNMTDTDAGWFMQTAQYGDPVVYFGDPYAPPMEVYNGLGGPWNIGWKEWRKNSAKQPRVNAPAPVVVQ
jgi:lipoprotein-anchoring transpeptidase ErfK/SrfK